MDQQENNKRVTAIVPAYNEADRIAPVLEVLATYPGFGEIIVVDDGSTDGTGDIARSFEVRYERNESNRGKGYSMDRGVALASGDIIFFCDADITGLTHQVLDDIITPVLSGEVDMFIGMRNRKWYFAHQIATLVPLLGGERALTKELWQMLPDYYKQYFRIEAALNFYSLYYGKGFQYKIFKGLAQKIKEKKYGFWNGFKQRLSMMINIFSAQLKLHFVHIPESDKNRRRMAMVAVQSLIGVLIGALFLVAVYYGPADFLTTLFAEELTEDPGALFINMLLTFVNKTAISTLLLIGWLILVPNIISLAFNFNKISYFFEGLAYKLKSYKSD